MARASQVGQLTVAGFYRYAVIDRHCQTDLSLAVTCPRVRWQAQRRSVSHPLEYATLLPAARRVSAGSHAWSRCSG